MTATIATAPANASKLTDTALIILNAAAQRDDRLLLPFPKSVRASTKIIKKTIDGLIAKALVEERPATLKDAIWRQDEAEQNFTLSITEAGVAALVNPPTQAEQVGVTVAKGEPKRRAESRKKARNSKPKVSATPKSGVGKGKLSQNRKAHKDSKAGQVLALLRRSNGTTLTEMMKVTEWQAHSVRGFLSGTVKKRMGLKLLSEQAEGKERRYRIKS